MNDDRARPLSWRDVATRGVGAGMPVAAIGVAVGVSLVLVVISGASPGSAVSALVDGAVGTPASTSGSLAKTVPLGLAALGWIVAWQARRINIGLEGQMLLGGAASALVGVELAGLPTAVHLPLAVAAGAVAGGLWAGIAAVLWLRRGVNEIFSTLMLNLAAVQVVEWLIRGPMAEGNASFARTPEILPTARWGRVVGSYVFSWDWVVLVAAVVVVGLVLPRTTAGYRLRLVGANPEAATYAGVRSARMSVLAMVASGSLAGLAGSSMILAGETYRMTDHFSGGYGYLAIVVALVAGNNPLAVLPSAFLFGALRQGGGMLEARAGVPNSIVSVTTGLIIVLLAAAAHPADRLRTRMAATRPAALTPPSGPPPDGGPDGRSPSGEGDGPGAEGQPQPQPTAGGVR
ncbi:MAG: simple sugar transport system permease protein [Acidimicrobiales bacterium]|nr:simple sugar transport system permease protein [Acidimicrobiales bacterium]